MSSSVPLARLTFLIVVLTGLGQMTQTLYVPSIGHMAKDFLVDPASLQAVMACYLIPYGLSQFVYGTLSDRFGRKPIIMVGLVIYLMGTLLALFAHEYSLFLAGSFIQGLGIGCGGVMSRTLTRDCFEGKALHKANSLVSMCLMFSPLIAPVLGGYLTSVFGWRSGYLFLALFGAAVVIAMMSWFVETLPASARKNERVSDSYRYVLGNRRFQGYLICLVATFAGVAVFEAAAGVLLGGTLHLKPTLVSILFIVPIPGYLAGAALSSMIASRWNENRALNFGLFAIVAGALVVLIPGAFGHTTVLTLIGGATTYFLGAGILFPAATTGAVSPFPYHAGTAGAVLGGMQNLGAGLATMAASFMPADNQMPLGILMLVASVFAMLGLRRVHHNVPPQEMPLTV